MYLYTLPMVRMLKTSHTFLRNDFNYKLVKETVHTLHFSKFMYELVLLCQQYPTRWSGFSLSQYMPVFSTVYTGTCLYFRIIEFKSIFYHNKCVRYMSEGRNSKTGLFTSAKEVMFSPGLARLFVNKITQKIMDGFW